MSLALSVTCLCAEWCSACREYREGFTALAARYPQWRFRWIDIEEQPEEPGAEDIETFPTVRVEQASRVLFFGPLPPQPEHLARLLESLSS